MSGSNGLIDVEYVCDGNLDCDSNRWETGIFKSKTCEATVPVNVCCNELSDYISDYCSYAYKCEQKKKGIVLEALIVSLKNANGSLALVTRLELRAITSLE